MAVEIGFGDAAEHPGKTARHVGFFRQVGGFQQRLADLRPGQLGHLLDAHGQNDLGLLAIDRAHRLIDRRRTGGAGVFHARRRFEAQGRIGLQHQRGGEILRREPAIEMAEIDFIDLIGGEARIDQRILHDADDQALDRFGVKFAKGAVRPANNASGHVGIVSGGIDEAALLPP